MVTLKRGKHAEAQQPEVSDIRVLKRADLAVLAIPRPTNTLAQLRDNHHRIARSIAAGLSNVQTAEICGVSINRISVLKGDPAFAELIAHYRGVITAEYAVAADPVIDFLRTNALKAAAMLSDKLDAAADADEFLPTRDLLGIAELGFDRTGYGKVNKNVNINVDFAAQLEAARKRSASAREPRQVEATSSRPQSAPVGPSAAPSRSVPPPLRRL